MKRYVFQFDDGTFDCWEPEQRAYRNNSPDIYQALLAKNKLDVWRDWEERSSMGKIREVEINLKLI